MMNDTNLIKLSLSGILLVLLAIISAACIAPATPPADQGYPTRISSPSGSFTVDSNTWVGDGSIIGIKTSSVALTTAEAATKYGTMNTALTEGNFAYKFSVYETGVATWPVSKKYTIEVFQNSNRLGIFRT